MASRQTQNDGRKQVELNLNPVALRPTVRAGGNYRVAVQQTPLTNSAMQLSNALKQGVGLYGQAVGIATKQGEIDADNMSDAEYDKFIQEGLDPEAKSLFGYTKAYNRKLSEKYYATEIPTKLQALSNEMFKSYYDYKDVASFEAALEERIGSVYEEADQLLGGNVFGEQANNALKSATRANFISNEVAKFSRELPERNKTMAMESMARNFAAISEENMESFFTTATDVFNTQEGTLGSRATAEAVYASTVTHIGGLINSKNSDDHDLAEAFLDTINDGKGEDSLVAGQELFATPARQAKLVELDAQLERSRLRNIEAGKKEATTLSASILADAYGQTTESDTLAFLEATEKELNENKMYEGNLVENSYTRDLLIIGINQAKANPQLFNQEQGASYISVHNNSADLLDTRAEARIPESMFTIRTGVNGNVKELNEAGQEFQREYMLEKDRAYADLLASVTDITDPEERRLAFKEGEKDVTVPRIEAWLDKTLNSSSAVAIDAQALEAKQNEAAVGPERVAEIKALVGENAPAVIKAEAEAVAADATDRATSETVEGRLVPAGHTPEKRVENFARLVKMGTLSEEDAFASFEVIHEDLWTNKTRRLGGASVSSVMPSEADKLLIGMVPVTRTYRGVTKTVKPSLEVQLVKAQQLANLMKIGGVPAEKIIEGGFSIGGGYSQTGRVSMDFMMKFNFIDFTQIPITIGGNIKNTVTAVQAWKDGGMTLENVNPQHRGTLNKIAEKYEMSVQQLMTFQNLYLTTNGYIKL
jgi:hypothetical protein